MSKTKDVRGDKVFDSRDAIARRDELKETRQDLKSEAEDYTNVVQDEAKAALAEWDAGDEAEELKDLEAFLSEGEGYGDFADGTACVADSYFEEFAQQEAEDLGLISRDVSWPYTCIDWGNAAQELQQDYSSAELAGETYWFRS